MPLKIIKNARHYRLISISLLLLFLFIQCDLSAEPTDIITQTEAISQPPLVQKVALIAALAIMPYAVMLLTSFMKMVIVLSLLRQALGVQNAPPNQVLNGMALLMAIYVMFPTATAMYEESKTYIQQEAPVPNSPIFADTSVNYLITIVEKSRGPLVKFLTKNSLQKHRDYFYQLAKQKFPPDWKSKINSKDLIILMPAYITSQVRNAFEIGVLIYLPFFVIDLVTSNILLAMGMMMLSPLTIALPLKLLLLVMVDGWTLLVQGVVLTYK